MKTVVLITLLNVLGLVFTYPITGQDDSVSCLSLPPERQSRLNRMIDEVSDFLYNLTEKYEDIDIPEVKMTVESNSETEDEEKKKRKEEKETSLSVIVNDCVESSNEDVQYWIENNSDAVPASFSQGINDDTECYSNEENDSFNQDCTAKDTGSNDSDDGYLDTTYSNEENEETSSGLEEQKKEAPHLELVTFNDEETKAIEELEKARGNRPFLMFDRGNGEQRIIL